MREPKRLLSDGASDFERQLLNAVMNERPSAAMRSRMQQGLGIAGPITWAANAKALFTSIATKGGLSAAIGGVVAAGGLAAAVGFGPFAADPGSDSSMTPSAVVAPAEVAPAPPPPAAAAPVALPELPSVAELEKDGAEKNRAEKDSQLREEIARLDAVRVALQQGARARALGELARYDESFPSGILSREANLLRRQVMSRGASSQRAHKPARK